jgi:8-oxo-dGTP pyrophosphatase MutT (NUDIX family)
VETIFRRSAKVLLVDENDRVLLCSAVDPSVRNGPQFWFAVGGGVGQSESMSEAAIREVYEETGLLIDSVGPAVLSRHASFKFEGEQYEQDED